MIRGETEVIFTFLNTYCMQSDIKIPRQKQCDGRFMTICQNGDQHVHMYFNKAVISSI